MVDIATDLFFAEWVYSALEMGREFMLIVMFTAIPLCTNCFGFCLITKRAIQKNPDYIILVINLILNPESGLLYMALQEYKR